MIDNTEVAFGFLSLKFSFAETACAMPALFRTRREIFNRRSDRSLRDLDEVSIARTDSSAQAIAPILDLRDLHLEGTQ